MSVETISEFEEKVKKIIKQKDFVVGDFLLDGDEWKYNLLVNSYGVEC